MIQQTYTTNNKPNIHKKIRRNSLKARPPPMKKDDPFYPGNDRRYEDLTEDQIPLTESLMDCMERGESGGSKNICSSHSICLDGCDLACSRIFNVSWRAAHAFCINVIPSCQLIFVILLLNNSPAAMGVWYQERNQKGKYGISGRSYEYVAGSHAGHRQWVILKNVQWWWSPQTSILEYMHLKNLTVLYICSGPWSFSCLWPIFYEDIGEDDIQEVSMPGGIPFVYKVRSIMTAFGLRDFASGEAVAWDDVAW